MDGVLAHPARPPMVLKPECGVPIKTPTDKSQPGVSGSVGQEQGLRMYVSNKFLGDASIAGLGPSLRGPLF